MIAGDAADGDEGEFVAIAFAAAEIDARHAAELVRAIGEAACIEFVEILDGEGDRRVHQRALGPGARDHYDIGVLNGLVIGLTARLRHGPAGQHDSQRRHRPGTIQETLHTPLRFEM